MFKVIETIETVKHESNNPELETEQVVYSVLLNGCCVGVSIGQDYTDEIIADIVAEKPELAPYIQGLGGNNKITPILYFFLASTV